MRKKILSLGELAQVREVLRHQGATLILTNGCFDILHVGHVRYLIEAKNMGDKLAVAINADESVRVLKGPRRPIFPEQERAEIVAALEPVDYVVIFPELTAESVVAALQPDIYVKGGDYSEEAVEDSKRDLPEARVARSYGGLVRILPLTPGRSTTETIRALLEGEHE